MKVNSCLIQDAVEAGYIKELAIFIQMKQTFVNSCIYNYTQQSLSEKTGFSRTFIRKHVAFFIKHKWVLFHGENLILKKLSEIDSVNKQKSIIDINKSKSYKEILEQLQYAYLKRKAEQAKWYSSLCRDLNKVTEEQRLRIEKKLSRKFPHLRIKQKKSYGESGNDRFRISIAKIAKWFGCSVGKAHGIIKTLCMTGYLDYTVRYITVKVKSTYEAKQRLIMDGKSFFTKRGYVCRVACNEYVFR